MPPGLSGSQTLFNIRPPMETMLSPKVGAICADISALRIQGARKIAEAAVKAMALQAEESDAATVPALKSDLLVAADELARARPTEPMLQNSLRFFFAELERRKPKTVSAARAAVNGKEKALLKRFHDNAEKIAEFGAKLIPDNGVLLTHCHSHTVVGAIRRAQETGKSPAVFCTETRPRYQGVITARELASSGVDVTLVIDSAAKTVLRKADIVLVGADSVTATGDLVNKIGTAGIATMALETDVPFYSCAELYKFDPLTVFGKATELEVRDPGEIADPYLLKGVRIQNYAFDKTDAKCISGYVTEKGVVSPHGLPGLALAEFGLG